MRLQHEVFRFEIKMDHFRVVNVGQRAQQLGHVVTQGGLTIARGLAQPVKQGRTIHTEKVK